MSLRQQRQRPGGLPEHTEYRVGKPKLVEHRQLDQVGFLIECRSGDVGLGNMGSPWAQTRHERRLDLALTLDPVVSRPALVLDLATSS